MIRPNRANFQGADVFELKKTNFKSFLTDLILQHYLVQSAHIPRATGWTSHQADDMLMKLINTILRLCDASTMTFLMLPKELE